MDYITIVHHTGPYVQLFKEICKDDEDNVYMATLLEFDEKTLADVINMLEKFTSDIQFTDNPAGWIAFTRSFPDAVLNLLFLDMHHMTVSLQKTELKTLVECFVLWFYLIKNYDVDINYSIFDIIPEMDVILYADFDEEQILAISNNDSDSNSSDDSDASYSQ